MKTWILFACLASMTACGQPDCPNLSDADAHAEQLLQKGGYRGARLLGLRLHAETLGGQQVAVYDGLEKIVD